MNLQELEISKQLKKFLSPSDYKLHDVLEAHGWRVLGSGVEATVAEKPGAPYVLKLFPNTSKYKVFVEFCKSHANNPHLPQFSRYVRPVPGTKWSYVRMEKLEPIASYTLRNTYGEYLCAVNELFLNRRHHPVYWNHAMSQQSIDDIPEKQGYVDLSACAQAAPAIWRQTLQQLVQLMKVSNMEQFDLHADNMMLRNQTLVITDPFV